MSAPAEQAPIRLNADFAAPALMRAAGAAWAPSPAPGVTRRMLDRIGGEVARVTSVVAYAPGSRFPSHTHGGGEEFLVLEGVFSDASGDFGPGAYVRNPPGTSHAPWTEGGCVILVKLRQMRPEDDVVVRVRPEERAWSPGAEGRETALLFEGPGERVSLERWAPGATDPGRALRGGAEIYVLEGALQTSEGGLDAGDWLRLPPGGELRATSAWGALVWMKQGHLAEVIGA